MGSEDDQVCAVAAGEIEDAIADRPCPDGHRNRQIRHLIRDSRESRSRLLDHVAISDRRPLRLDRGLGIAHDGAERHARRKTARKRSRGWQRIGP